MSIFSKVWSWLMTPKYPKINPEKLEVISGDEVLSIIKKQFKGKKLPEIHRLDRRYRLIPEKKLYEFLDSDIIDKKQYIKDFFDCDDYTIVVLGKLKYWCPGICAGTAIVSYKKDGVVYRHMLIVYITTDRKLQFCEPQTDLTFDIPEKWNVESLEI